MESIAFGDLRKTCVHLGLHICGMGRRAENAASVASPRFAENGIWLGLLAAGIVLMVGIFTAADHCDKKVRRRRRRGPGRGEA